MSKSELLEYVIRYWYIILALIGFAASMFVKRVGEPAGTGRGAAGGGGMPTFGGSTGGSRGQARSERSEAGEARGQARGERNEAGEARGRARGERSEAGEARAVRAAASPWDAELAPPAGAPRANAAAQVGSDADEVRSAAELGNGPSQHALAQGVLWAEILGPPRAKNPRMRR